MKQDMTQILNEIRQMNDLELNDVIEAVKMQRQFLARTTIRKLAVGDDVEFTSTRDNRKVQGKVRKIGRKWVQVTESNSITTWRVPANMLRTRDIAA